MKKFLLFSVILLMAFCPAFGGELNSSAGNLVLRGAVSEIPTAMIGMWRVVSNIEETDAPLTFRKNSLDLWNLIQTGNVIKLCNPFNGAEAEITLLSSNNKHLVFEKKKNYKGKLVTDTVELELSGDYFKGYNKLKLETLSDIDGHVVKTEHATYKITGERISGGEI